MRVLIAEHDHAIYARLLRQALPELEVLTSGDSAELARQAASLLYHAVSMAALRWEAVGDGLASRALLADQVLQHRLAPRDPYAIPADESAACRGILHPDSRSLQ